MAETHLISGLVAKRAEIAGEVLRLRRQIVALQADLAAIDRTLVLSGYQDRPDAIRPVIRRRLRHRGRGDLQRFILDSLRDAVDPVPSCQLVDRYMVQRRAPQQERERYRKAVLGCLARLRTRGFVEMVGAPRHARWRALGADLGG